MAALPALAFIALMLSACTTEKTVTDPAPATVSGVSPATGAEGGGTFVTVYGSGFETGASVSFGTAYATSVTVTSETQLTCLTPAGSPGAADVVVGSHNRVAGSLTGGFTFVHWWNSDWTRRMPFTVTGSTAGALAGYPLEVTVPYDTDMLADFADLRFSQWDGTELPLAFWTASTAPGSQAVCWVRLASVPASPATVTVYVYYGNSQALPASDFDATFDKDFTQTGLLGLWHLDEGTGMATFDGSGNGNQGLLEGFVWPYGWLGVEGAAWPGRSDARFSLGDAVSLDGRDDAIDCGSSQTLDASSALTVEAWAKAYDGAVNGREQVIASKWMLHQKPGFQNANNWEAFDAGQPLVGADGGFSGGLFDGRYIIFTPFHSSGAHGEFLRYDTHADFQDPLVWSTYDPGAAGAAATPWSTKASLVTGRESAACTVYNGKIYVFGGHDGTSPITSAVAYDPGTDTWATLAALPTARNWVQAAVVGSLIYVIGGSDSGGTAQNLVDIYDPVTDTWTAGAVMPTARTGLVLEAMNGLLYALGGDDGTGVRIATTEIYNPAADTWSTGADMPTPRQWAGSAVLDGRIYVFGGSSSATNAVATAEAYVPSADTWETRTNLNLARRGPASGLVDGKIYCIAGYNGGYLTQVEEYDPHADAWIYRSGLPSTARWAISSATVGNTIYLVGGNSTVTYHTDVEAYQPLRDFAGYDLDGYTSAAFDGRYAYFVPYYNGSAHHGTFLRFDTQGAFDDLSSWQVFDPGNWGIGADPDGYRVAAFDGRYLHFAPLYNGSNYHGVFLRHDTQASFRSARAWTAYDPGANGVGTRLDGFNSATFDGRFVYFGGHQNNTEHHGEILRYDTQAEYTDAASWAAYDHAPGSFVPWSAKRNMPTTRDRMGIATYNDRIYVIGGGVAAGHTTAVEEYNPIADTWRTRTAMPTGRHDPGCAVVGDDIYVTGGKIAAGPVLPTVEKYNVPSNTWTTGLANMPTTLTYHGCVTLNGMVYIVGGDINGAGAITTSVRYYNPSTNGWTNAPSMNVGRSAPACAVVDGKIYAFGGYNAGSLSSVEVYDPQAGNWAFLTNMGVSRHGMAVAVLGRKIIVMGGHNSFIPVTLTLVEEYDTVLGTWRTLAPLSNARYVASGAAVDGKVYIIGGYTSTQINTTEEYDPSQPVGIYSAAFDGRYMYFICSRSSGDYITEVLRLDCDMPFSDRAAWQTFRPRDHGMGRIEGASWGCHFDGRYLYLVADRYGPNSMHGEFLRYDTRAPFRETSSWCAFTPRGQGQVPLNAWGFIGAVSDGRHIYFCPYRDPGYYSQVLRFDTTGENASFKLSWSGPEQSPGYAAGPIGLAAVINTADGVFTAAADTDLAPGAWRHVALTYDGTTLALFLDGAQVASSEASGVVCASTAPLVLGGFAEGNANFHGAIDEVRLYDRALPPGEVLSHAQRRPFADPEPSVGAAGAEEQR
jgi:N-acetylneuraminic acid mutarotase